jgi:transposase
MFVGDDGFTQQLVLPPSYLAQWDMVNQKRSKIDTDLNALRDILSGHTTPEPFKHWRNFRHPERFARAFREWRDTNPECNYLFGVAKEWYRTYQHDRRHADGRQSNLIASRNHGFKTFARQLTDRYAVLLMDTIDLATLAKRPNADAPLTDNERAALNAARSQRQKAGVSQLRSALQQCGISLPKMSDDSCRYTSMDCSYCGHRNKKAKDLQVQCESCMRDEDRDVRSCRNTLRRFSGKTPPDTKQIATTTVKVRAILGRKNNRRQLLAA